MKGNMFFRAVASVIIVIFLAIGCTKPGNAPTPTPPPVPPTPVPPVIPSPVLKPDTLSVGWTKMVIDSSMFFTDVLFNSNTNGYLAGKKLFHSVNGGATWQAAASREVNNLGLTPDGKVFLVNNNDTIFRSLDAGNTLTGFKTPGANGFDVYFVDNKNGYYITDAGAYLSSDGGVSWVRLNIPNINFPSGYSTMFFTDTANGFILASAGVYRTDGSISTWKKAIFPPMVVEPQSISITPDNTVYVTTLQRQLFKSTDGGLNFELINTFPTSAGFFCDVHFVDNITGYVCAGNRIFKTTDAGNTWSMVVSLGEAYLIEIHFTDAKHGWACGSKGTVLKFNL